MKGALIPLYILLFMLQDKNMRVSISDFLYAESVFEKNNILKSL